MKYPLNVLQRHRAVRLGALVVIVALPVFLATRTVTTKQGVNYQQSVRRIPVYVKAVDFVHRHYQYQLLTSEIIGGRTSDVDRVLAIFDWTHQRIRQTPAGWPIVDDHVLNIVIRGHGMSDQIADVFATLSTYAGVPAFWKAIKSRNPDTKLVLAFARIDGRWTPFDVGNGVSFRDRQGALASVDALIADPSLADANTENVLPDGVKYSMFISKATLEPWVVPRALRSDLQRPWPRLQYEIRRAVGFTREGR